ncbi:MAG: hypothetical protein ACREON_13105 [Gemmatimonadaceae bacterium]
MSAQLHALRQFIAEQFPNARPLVERDAHRLADPIATRISALDRALPGGGLPRGKLTAWSAATGAAAILRATCRGVIAGGERAAWVDALRTLTFGWAAAVTKADSAVQADGVPIIIHPADRVNALRATELLLRSGAFALVVLDGAEPIGTETVRLTRAARDGGGALVVLTECASMAALRVSSRLDLHGVRWRRGPFGDPAAPVDMRAEIRVRALGWNARATISFPVAAYDLRCALEPDSTDRRGARSRDGG